jgi:hypothetical protein
MKIAIRLLVFSTVLVASSFAQSSSLTGPGTHPGLPPRIGILTGPGTNPGLPPLAVR